MWQIALVLACAAVPTLLSDLPIHGRRVRLLTKGGRLMNALFTMLARAVDLLTISTTLTGTSCAR